MYHQSLSILFPLYSSFKQLEHQIFKESLPSLKNYTHLLEPLLACHFLNQYPLRLELSMIQQSVALMWVLGIYCLSKAIPSHLSFHGQIHSLSLLKLRLPVEPRRSSHLQSQPFIINIRWEPQRINSALIHFLAPSLDAAMAWFTRSAQLQIFCLP